MVSNNMTEMSSEDTGQWLKDSRVLNLEDQKLKIQGMRIKQLACGARQNAVFINDFVKSFPFGCVPAFDQVPDAAVMCADRGCHDTTGFSLLTFLH